MAQGRVTGGSVREDISHAPDGRGASDRGVAQLRGGAGANRGGGRTEPTGATGVRMRWIIPLPLGLKRRAITSSNVECQYYLIGHVGKKRKTSTVSVSTCQIGSWRDVYRSIQFIPKKLLLLLRTKAKVVGCRYRLRTKGLAFAIDKHIR